MDALLPWERWLWSGRSLRVPRRRYRLTDLRLVCTVGGVSHELALYDLGEVRISQTRLQRWLGVSTVTVFARDPRRAAIELADIRQAPQLAAAFDLLASESPAVVDASALRAALTWTPSGPGPRRRVRVAGVATAALALTVSAIGLRGYLHRQAPPVIFAADDAIAPSGVKRDREAIVQFMEATVMPWARLTLAPVVGSESDVTCETCHGGSGPARAWQMPAVAVLPQPIFRELGWERYSRGMDPQIRNAIYGYTAESDKQSTATYMREVVMPGMAHLLRRPPYDFTRTYDYNRSHQAFGCYHCHRVN